MSYLLEDQCLFSQTHKGYFAGESDGILTVANAPAARDIVFLDPNTFEPLYFLESMTNGRWMLVGVPIDKEFLIIARDYSRQYEPFCYDHIKAHEAATASEAYEMWKSWQ